MACFAEISSNPSALQAMCNPVGEVLGNFTDSFTKLPSSYFIKKWIILGLPGRSPSAMHLNFNR